MKEQLPSPDFNRYQYERPNQNWICGHAAEGKACRIGPDNKGHCRATYECQPALKVKSGESKGRYECTRPAEYGGPCSQGPLPDGTCCRPITKCVPVRSLRSKRKLLAICVVAFTAAVLLIGLCGPFRPRFINPGRLSSQHSTATFAKMAGAHAGEDTCVACHGGAHTGPHGLVRAAFNATPGPFQIHALASSEPPGMNAIDHNCEECHVAHSFHEPNVVRALSCSACHREHQGSGLMPKPANANCLFCHANAQVMQASLELGKKLPLTDFDFRPAQGRVLFKAPRPENGYTELIHSFADHPEFQVLAQKLKDPDTLKFNHHLHLTSPNIPQLNGHKLDCSDCHKPDAAGVYYLKISYEENCKACHSLQFDVENPGLLLPHGNVEHVRAFLRSLPEQYAEFGAKEKGITGETELQQFVQKQMAQIREHYGSGEELERRVFFSDARSGPVTQVAGTIATGAARFPGCAYCHEVSSSADGAPIVTAPVIPDRWLIRGQFDHSKHFKIACTQCHDAEHSRETADVILPSKTTCVQCHSPKGGVASSCSTCHTFHSARKDFVSAGNN